MEPLQIKLIITGYWHASSGKGEGALVDSTPIKLPNGLPFLPGRSVKGLFREAFQIASESGQIESGRISELFGGFVDETRYSRYDTEKGALHFSDAIPDRSLMELADEEVQEQAGNSESILSIPHLFRTLYSTRLDDSGQAEDHSLRSIEVSVPLDLHSTIECSIDDRDWKNEVKLVAPLIKHLGSHRHRGLGDVILEIEEDA